MTYDNDSCSENGIIAAILSLLVNCIAVILSLLVNWNACVENPASLTRWNQMVSVNLSYIVAAQLHECRSQRMTNIVCTAKCLSTNSCNYVTINRTTGQCNLFGFGLSYYDVTGLQVYSLIQIHDEVCLH